MGLFIESIGNDQEFLDKHLQDVSVVFYAAINSLYKEMAVNWYLHILKCGRSIKNILILCLDLESYTFLKDKNIPCVFFDISNCTELKNINIIKQFYNVDHHIIKYAVGELIVSKYNVDLIYLDIDMIVLKDPANYIFSLIREKNADSCAITDKSYSQITCMKKFVNNSMNYGGMMLYWNKDIFNKINNITSVKFSFDQNADFRSIKTVLNLNVAELNSFLFPSSYIWDIPFIKKTIKNTCYIVHYHTSSDVNSVEKDHLKVILNNKITKMKDSDHWLL